MRGSDSERERACEALQKAYVQGRISTEQLEQRIERAQAADTLDQLQELLKDLPYQLGPVSEGGEKSKVSRETSPQKRPSSQPWWCSLCS